MDNFNNSEISDDKSILSTEDLVEEGEYAGDYLEQFLDILDLDGDLDLDVINGQAVVNLTNCPEASILIGRFGRTLNALQRLTRLAVKQASKHSSKLLLDVDGWRNGQKERLIEYGKRIAHKVKQSNADIELRPMSSYERKIIHDAVSKISGISTKSIGEDPERRIVISVEK